MAKGEAAPAAVLRRHFLRQWFSLDGIATGGEIKEIVAAVLTLLAAPGYLLAVVTVLGGPRLGQWWRVAHLPPLLRYWKEEWLILTLSMAAAAVLTTVHWRSFVLAARDYRILGPLPVRRSTVVLAKLASLALVVLTLHAGVNVLSGVLLPVVSPAGYWRTLPALQLTLLLQTVFACASVIALQAIVAVLLPPALVRAAAPLVQAGVLLAVVVLVVGADTLSEQALAAAPSAFAAPSVVPVAWFMALYKRLLGFDSPQVAADARLALLSTAAVVLVASAGCLSGYRDAEGHGTRAARWLARWAAAVDVALSFRHPAAPRARAISAFASKAAWRSPGVALIARGWLVVGIGVTLAGFGAAMVRGELRAAAPVAVTVAPGIVLPFFGLLGFRLAAAYPACLEANWLFRLSDSGETTAGASAIRSVAWRTIVIPLVAATAAVQTLLWGPGVAVPLALVCLVIGLATAEWLFLGFRRIPFTCSYRPGKANLRASWPLATAVGFVYCVALPEVVAQAIADGKAWITLLVLLGLLWACLFLLARRMGTGAPVFDDRPPPFVTELHLDD